MTKDARTNPNPLYPKNLGYQFRGYFLGESSIPTFMYRSGTIGIEDRSATAGSEELRQLKRVLTFESPMPQVVWFRALTGDIIQNSELVYQIGRMRLTLPTAETKMRPLPNDPKRSELLLRLQIPQGKSSLELLYEPLKK